MELDNTAVSESATATDNPAAGGEQIAEVENQSEVQTQEGSEKVDSSVKEPPEHFRRGYEALEKDVNEKYKPLSEKVASYGGIEVIEAMKPLLELATNENVEPETVVSTLRSTLLPQHLEAVAWAALDNPETQRVILEDPDVLTAISQKLFNGRSIEDVQNALALSDDSDIDPELAAVKKQLAERDARDRQAAESAAATQANQRVTELQDRFFEKTCDGVLNQFSLVAPNGASDTDKQVYSDAVTDLKYAAQGRFLAEHANDYMRIQEMYARGLQSQAKIAETRLQNAWQATLIKTAERYSQQLKARTDAVKADLKAKTEGVRPDVSGGNVENSSSNKQERYDLNDPNWLTKFLAEFKQEAANR
jgi:hypothetical protein